MGHEGVRLDDGKAVEMCRDIDQCIDVHTAISVGFINIAWWDETENLRCA